MSEPVIDLGILAHAGARPLRFAAADRIFAEDDEGCCMYVVQSGRVSIRSDNVVLETIGANGVFGEMSLIDGSARSATAVALDAAVVVPIDRNAFFELVRHDPEFALRLMRLLSKRIRRTNEGL